MKAANTDKIIEVVNLCPTEALTWKWNDDEKNMSVGPDQTNHVKFRRPDLMERDLLTPKENPVSVKAMIDGPIVIKGNFTLNYGGNKTTINESLVSICRCGESDHQPFCDGQHRKTGFIG
jgi:CDGSH-type Zn-finger protein